VTRWRGLGASAEDRRAGRAKALAARAAEAATLDWAAPPQQAVVACVVLNAEAADLNATPLGQLAADLRGHVRETIGGLAQPQAVAFLDELPVSIPRAELRQAGRIRRCQGPGRTGTARPARSRTASTRRSSAAARTAAGARACRAPGRRSRPGCVPRRPGR
jgi:AMP-binding enzyme C-terminal domain